MIFSEGWFAAFMNLVDPIFAVANPCEVATSANAIVSVDASVLSALESRARVTV